MNARHHQHPVTRVTARWADPSFFGGPKRVEFLEEPFDRTTDEYCAHCGRRDALWEGERSADRERSSYRLCTACGWLTRFNGAGSGVPHLEPATDHWATILGWIRKAAGENAGARRGG